jgi:hypothetical protein
MITMAWTTTTKTTKHTCGGPVFGRKTPGCPRCDELLAGAPAVQWANSTRRDDEQRCREIRAHYEHKRREYERAWLDRNAAANSPALWNARYAADTFGDW